MSKSADIDLGASRWALPIVFLIVATILVVRTILSPGPLFADTDDAMRLVVVRDFLAGQNWYDLVQHRLDTPFGAEVHWSRFVDLPIATIIYVLTPVLGADGATIGAAYVWPLTLLAALLAVSAGLARRLLGPVGVMPALVLPALSPAIFSEFVPGRIDHHNVEILLTLAIVWASVEALQRPRFAWLAGVLCATALAIATESLPTIAAAIMVFALLWVVDPRRSDQLRGFGLGFGLAAMAHLALARPPSRWLEPACDMISSVYVGGALVVAIAFVAVTLLPTTRSPWFRLVVLGSLGALGLAGLLTLDPQCLAGPYGGVDLWLRQNWLTNIAEAKPWAVSVVDLPVFSLAVGLPVLFGLVVVCIRIVRFPQDREQWLVLLAFMAFATAIMLLQVRGARLAVMPAIPAAAWIIASAWERFERRRGLISTLRLILACLAFSGSGIVLVVAAVSAMKPGHAQAVAAAQADKLPCLLPSAFADLKALPPERIMTPIDLGSHMLLETPHSVVAAPYHRNTDGLHDTFDFFNQPIERARAILERRGVGLVVTCPAMAEMAGLPDRAPDSFSALAEKNALPDWLADVSLGGPLKIYAVLPR